MNCSSLCGSTTKPRWRQRSPASTSSSPPGPSRAKRSITRHGRLERPRAQRGAPRHGVGARSQCARAEHGRLAGRCRRHALQRQRARLRGDPPEGGGAPPGSSAHGPDCGTAIVGGVGLCFAMSCARRGPASSPPRVRAPNRRAPCDAAGIGVSAVLGTGGRYSSCRRCPLQPRRHGRARRPRRHRPRRHDLQAATVRHGQLVEAAAAALSTPAVVGFLGRVATTSPPSRARCWRPWVCRLSSRRNGFRRSRGTSATVPSVGSSTNERESSAKVIATTATSRRPRPRSVFPTNTLPLATIGVMNLLPGPN